MSDSLTIATPDLRHIRFEGVPAPAREVPAPSAAAPGFVAGLLRRRALPPDAYQALPLQRRLSACLRKLRAATEAEARARLEAEPGRIAEVLDALLIGVTGFFRDGEVFERLAGRLVPALAAPGGPIRVLSAGCSDGPELVSVALLLAEAGALERSALLGVDLRPSAVRRAAAGVFPRAAAQAVGPALLEKYFTVRDVDAVLQPGVRARLRWAVGDLFRLPARGPFDLVLFRNVAIYLREEGARRVWTALADALAPGGWLVAGRAETPPGDLPLRRADAALFRKERA